MRLHPSVPVNLAKSPCANILSLGYGWILDMVRFVALGVVDVIDGVDNMFRFG